MTRSTTTTWKVQISCKGCSSHMSLGGQYGEHERAREKERWNEEYTVLFEIMANEWTHREREAINGEGRHDK